MQALSESQVQNDIHPMKQFLLLCSQMVPQSDVKSALRPAQIRLLDQLKSKQNKIVVARTGFGKTRNAQEHINMLLQHDKAARTNFLTNQTMLAMQQTSKLQQSTHKDSLELSNVRQPHAYASIAQLGVAPQVIAG